MPARIRRNLFPGSLAGFLSDLWARFPYARIRHRREHAFIGVGYYIMGGARLCRAVNGYATPLPAVRIQGLASLAPPKKRMLLSERCLGMFVASPIYIHLALYRLDKRESPLTAPPT